MAKAKVLESTLGEGPAIVFPVEGAFLHGIPAVPLTCDGDVAARLVATGAFRWEAPEVPEDGPPPLIEVIPLPDDALAALDHYHAKEADQ